ncbi:MAG: hypothetical protein KatS3mg126_1582 [Lysobacteraceae bacterium]|nr:MAG: hypothetical protein KatS3mg126_1582 [Xanthomonadaceae bacterium]
MRALTLLLCLLLALPGPALALPGLAGCADGSRSEPAKAHADDAASHHGCCCDEDGGRCADPGAPVGRTCSDGLACGTGWASPGLPAPACSLPALCGAGLALPPVPALHGTPPAADIFRPPAPAASRLS